MNFENQEKVIEYINSLVSSSLNKILYNLPVEKDIEIVIIDENKSFGYVVLYLPVQDENINLGYIPFVTDYSYCKFLFLQIQDEVYPLESRYIERLIPPQILQQLREQQTLNKTSEYKNYKETAQDIIYSKYSEKRLEKIKNIIKNLKKSEKKLIPESIKKKIRSKSEREKMPAHYFLMPKERKFPVKDPTTGKYHCGLIRAAITRAAQHKYEQVEKKARKLYEKHCKNKKSSSDILLELNYVNDEKYIANYLYKHSEYINENTLSYILPYLINPYDLPQNNINLSPLLVYYTLDKTSNLLDYENNVKSAGAGTVIALLAGLGLMGALGFAGYKYMKHHEDYNNKHLQLFGEKASFMDKLMGSVFYSGDLLKHKFGVGEKELFINLNNELSQMKGGETEWNGMRAKVAGYSFDGKHLYNILSEIKNDNRFEKGLKEKNFKTMAQAIVGTPRASQYLHKYYEVDTKDLIHHLKDKGNEYFEELERKILSSDISNDEKIYHLSRIDHMKNNFLKDDNKINKVLNNLHHQKRTIVVHEHSNPYEEAFKVTNTFMDFHDILNMVKDKNVKDKIQNILGSNVLDKLTNPLSNYVGYDEARAIVKILRQAGFFDDIDKKRLENYIGKINLSRESFNKKDTGSENKGGETTSSTAGSGSTPKEQSKEQSIQNQNKSESSPGGENREKIEEESKEKLTNEGITSTSGETPKSSEKSQSTGEKGITQGVTIQHTTSAGSKENKEISKNITEEKRNKEENNIIKLTEDEKYKIKRGINASLEKIGKTGEQIWDGSGEHIHPEILDNHLDPILNKIKDHPEFKNAFENRNYEQLANIILKSEEARKYLSNWYEIKVPKFIQYLRKNQNEFFENVKKEIKEKYTGEYQNKKMEELEIMKNILNDDEKINKVLGSIDYHGIWHLVVPGEKPSLNKVGLEVLSKIYKGYKVLETLKKYSDEEVKQKVGEENYKIFRGYWEKFRGRKEGSLTNLSWAYNDLKKMGLIEDSFEG